MLVVLKNALKMTGKMVKYDRKIAFFKINYDFILAYFDCNFGIDKLPKVLWIQQKKELSIFVEFEESYSENKAFAQFAAPCINYLF